MKSIFYDWGGLNIWLFHAINNLRGELIDPLMQLGTIAGMHQLFWLYLSLLLLARLRVSELAEIRGQAISEQQTTAWLIAIATLICAYLINGWLVGVLKQYFNFPRPPLVLPAGTFHLLTHKSDLHHSLPSGHTIFAATFTASLWPLAGIYLRFALALFVIWVGISRISLGIHFPADVVYGAIAGVSLVSILRQLLWLAARYQQRIT